MPPKADTFPLDGFREAATHMRRPFTPEAVKFKVQATWPKDNPHSGMIVAYIDARLVVERLNLLVPHLWHDAYRPVGQGQMWCDLTIDGITRSDIGEGQGKALVSDALKRAAVRFGIGVSLYAIPRMTLTKQDGSLKDARTQKGPTLALTPKGETVLRGMYSHWLEQHGSQAFGDPLDHGDVANHQGDPETGEAPEGVDPETGEIKPETIGQERATAIAQLFSQRKMKTREIIDYLNSVGAELGQGATVEAMLDAIGRLSPHRAHELEALIEKTGGPAQPPLEAVA